MSDSHLHDTKPELALATEILEELLPMGWEITGQDTITVKGQTYSIDRIFAQFKGKGGKGKLLFEVHANHDWMDIPESDVKKTLALLSENNLINIYLKANQIKRWANSIIYIVREAMLQAELGKKVYRAIYQDNSILHSTMKVGVF